MILRKRPGTRQTGRKNRAAGGAASRHAARYSGQVAPRAGMWRAKQRSAWPGALRGDPRWRGRHREDVGRRGGYTISKQYR